MYGCGIFRYILRDFVYFCNCMAIQPAKSTPYTVTVTSVDLFVEPLSTISFVVDEMFVFMTVSLYHAYT